MTLTTEQRETGKRKAGRRPLPAARYDGLFPCEEETARRLSQDPTDWKAVAIVLERHGLPPVDPLMGGRYWPAVIAFWNRRYSLSSVEPSQPDGEDNYDALR